VIVRSALDSDDKQLVPLIAAFRVELAALKQRKIDADLNAASAELADYRAKGFRLAVAESDEGRLIGFIACRIDGDVVWAESLYVVPEFRRKGVASKLYEYAEAIAEELGSDTVYNWVHPNNAAIIAFLRKRGYDVLNLIEIRRQYTGEHISGEVMVGSERFRY
jgi:ribosomal protein S18 acetylase RimI-like enzyme